MTGSAMEPVKAAKMKKKGSFSSLIAALGKKKGSSTNLEGASDLPVENVEG